MTDTQMGETKTEDKQTRQRDKRIDAGNIRLNKCRRMNEASVHQFLTKSALLITGNY